MKFAIFALQLKRQDEKIEKQEWLLISKISRDFRNKNNCGLMGPMSLNM